MAKPEVIVLGGCVTDLIVYTPRFPVPGETLVAKLFQYGYGGKGANSAYMCSRLGLDTALVGKLGDDHFGQKYLKYLETAGIDARHVVVEKGCASATANITVADNGENSIAYFPGCVDRVTEADVERAESMFRTAKVFACVFEAPMASIRRALELAHQHGVTTYINAAPIVSEHLPKDCLRLIDYLCVNETEGSALICQILNKPRVVLSDEDIVDFLLSAGVGTVIMTKGGKGATYSQGSTRLRVVPVEPVTNVVDTTGAGDAFNGSFIYQLVRNSQLSIEDKVRKACGIASLTVQRKGTQSSYPRKDEVPDKFL